MHEPRIHVVIEFVGSFESPTRFKHLKVGVRDRTWNKPADSVGKAVRPIGFNAVPISPQQRIQLNQGTENQNQLTGSELNPQIDLKIS